MSNAPLKGHLISTLEKQLTKCLFEKFILDTAKSMHFCPIDVDIVLTTENTDVRGLELVCLKVSSDNDGLSYRQTYQWEWLTAR
jgi:hypothetical protein